MRRFALLALLLTCVTACRPPQSRATVVVTTPASAGPVACDDCLMERAPVSVQRGTVGSKAITVDAKRSFQKIDGFGFAMTDSSAYLIDQVPNDAGQRTALMRKLFDPVDGIGISWMRIVMGPSDFTVAKPPWYSYRSSPAERFDVGRPRPGSPSGDYSHIIPLLREANVLAKRQISFFADPHSAPAWMKRNNMMSSFEPESCILGYCANSSVDVRDDYVEYFVDFVKTYQSAGIPIDSLGIQNEPDSNADFPSGDFALADQVDFINRLKLRLSEEHLSQKLLAEFINPIHAGEVFANPQSAAAIDGIAYHCYGLELKTLAEVFDGVKLLRAAYPNKSLQETECTQDGQHIWPSTIDTLIDHARRGANSIANWNLALDPQGGPHSGLCSEVRNGRCYDTGTSSIMTAPVVISGPAGHATATFTREYYEMGQFTKFVRPGAVRIASTESPNLNNVAFRNPDGSKVLIVHNLRDERTTFAVNTDDDHHFDVDLRANAIATLTW